MQFFYSKNIVDKYIILENQEMKHCTYVLRKKINDLVNVVDGKGIIFSCKIIEINLDDCKLLILKKKKCLRNRNIHLCIAPTKNHKRMEWMVEKIVEIGIDKITFIICANSIRTSVNLKRLNKIALSAMKQSQSTYLPKITQCTSFKTVLEQDSSKHKYIAHLNNDKIIFLNKTKKIKTSICILIGPEGDFTKEEINYSLDKEFIEVSLGNTRLRTETAGIVSVTMLNNNE